MSSISYLNSTIIDIRGSAVIDPILDARLLDLLSEELVREGGTCNAELLITLNPTLRKLLGDRRLISFIKDYPTIFSVKYQTVGANQQWNPNSHILISSSPSGTDCSEQKSMTTDMSNPEGEIPSKTTIKVSLLANFKEERSKLMTENTNLATKHDICAASSAALSSSCASLPSFSCTSCTQIFGSRNKLFAHIKKVHAKASNKDTGNMQSSSSSSSSNSRSCPEVTFLHNRISDDARIYYSDGLTTCHHQSSTGKLPLSGFYTLSTTDSRKLNMSGSSNSSSMGHSRSTSGEGMSAKNPVATIPVKVPRLINELLFEIMLAMQGMTSPPSAQLDENSSSSSCNMNNGNHDSNSSPISSSQSSSIVWCAHKKLLGNKKVKRLLHTYVRSMSFEELLPSNRYEYDTKDWWARASIELMKLLNRAATSSSSSSSSSSLSSSSSSQSVANRQPHFVEVNQTHHSTFDGAKNVEFDDRMGSKPTCDEPRLQGHEKQYEHTQVFEILPVGHIFGCATGITQPSLSSLQPSPVAVAVAKEHVPVHMVEQSDKHQRFLSSLEVPHASVSSIIASHGSCDDYLPLKDTIIVYRKPPSIHLSPPYETRSTTTPFSTSSFRNQSLDNQSSNSEVDGSGSGSGDIHKDCKKPTSVHLLELVAAESLAELLKRRCVALIPSKYGGRITLGKLLADIHVRKYCLERQCPLPTEVFIDTECSDFLSIIPPAASCKSSSSCSDKSSSSSSRDSISTGHGGGGGASSSRRSSSSNNKKKKVVSVNLLFRPAENCVASGNILSCMDHNDNSAAAGAVQQATTTTDNHDRDIQGGFITDEKSAHRKHPHIDLAAIILHRDSELCVVNKPAGVSMEALVKQLQMYIDQESNNIVNVPSSVLVVVPNISTGTQDAVAETMETEQYRIQSVSRLDQQTSGAVLIPLTKKLHDSLTVQFKEKLVRKAYIAIVSGKVGSGAGYCGEVVAKLKHVGGDVLKTMVQPNGKFAHTLYCCLHVYDLSQRVDNGYSNSDAASINSKCESGEPIIVPGIGADVGVDDDDADDVALGGSTRSKSKSKSNAFSATDEDSSKYVSVVLCYPLTGRTHQIRVHMAHIGHSLLGDYKYSNIQFRKKVQHDKKLLLLAQQQQQQQQQGSLTLSVQQQQQQQQQFENDNDDGCVKEKRLQRSTSAATTTTAAAAAAMQAQWIDVPRPCLHSYRVGYQQDQEDSEDQAKLELTRSKSTAGGQLITEDVTSSGLLPQQQHQHNQQHQQQRLDEPRYRFHNTVPVLPPDMMSVIRQLERGATSGNSRAQLSETCTGTVHDDDGSVRASCTGTVRDDDGSVRASCTGTVRDDDGSVKASSADCFIDDEDNSQACLAPPQYLLDDNMLTVIDELARWQANSSSVSRQQRQFRGNTRS